MNEQKFENKMIVKNNCSVQIRNVAANNEVTLATDGNGIIKDSYWRKLQRKKCNGLRFDRIVDKKQILKSKKEEMPKKEKTDFKKSKKIDGGKK